jgi:hypothetical protein
VGRPPALLAHLSTLLRPGGRYIGAVPSRSLIWKLRFLSSSCPADQPCHKNFGKAELRALLSKHFSSGKVGTGNMSMRLYFVATK